MAVIQRDFRKDKPKPLRVRMVCGENEIVSLSSRAQSRELATKNVRFIFAAGFLHFVPTCVETPVGTTFVNLFNVFFARKGRKEGVT
jgi:hypothetical protein